MWNVVGVRDQHVLKIRLDLSVKKDIGHSNSHIASEWWHGRGQRASKRGRARSNRKEKAKSDKKEIIIYVKQ